MLAAGPSTLRHREVPHAVWNVVARHAPLPAPCCRSQSRWQIDPKPLAEIGTAGGAEEYLFKQVRSATRLSDGRIVVADPGMTDVRVFDSKGKFLSRIGRKGQGPGEYRSPFWVGAGRGDTILVYDYSEGPGHLHRYASDGKFVRSSFIQTSVEASAAKPLRLAGDGSVVMFGSYRPSYAPEKKQPYRGQVGVVRVSADGAVTPLGRYPGQWIEHSISTPFSTDAWRAANDSLVFVGDGETPTITAYGHDGKQRRSTKLPVSPRPITAADKDAWRERLLELAANDPANKASIEAQIARTIWPTHFPLFTTFLTDRVGNLWVGMPVSMKRPSVTEYIVLDPSLRTIAKLETLPGFHPLEIGPDYVLGVALDDDDVPHVRLHRLVKR